MMAKRRLDTVDYLTEFSKRSQGNRRRNSCYAFMNREETLDVSLIRRNPVNAFWALAERVGPKVAQQNVKEGKYVLVEVHLYANADLKRSKPSKIRTTHQLDNHLDQEEVPDHDEYYLRGNDV